MDPAIDEWGIFLHQTLMIFCRRPVYKGKIHQIRNIFPVNQTNKIKEMNKTDKIVFICQSVTINLQRRS